MTKLRVAVIYGGISPEHEVSIITGVQAMASMPTKFEVIPLYVTKSGDILTGNYLLSIDSYKDLSLLEKKAEQISLPYSPNSITLTPTKASLIKKRSKPFDVIFPCFHGKSYNGLVPQKSSGIGIWHVSLSQMNPISSGSQGNIQPVINY